MVIGVAAYLVAMVVVFGAFGLLLARAKRRREARRADRRDQERAQAELAWLQGRPVMAPHVVYRTEAEYDSDLQRMALMGYQAVQVYRTESADGWAYDVRYQLLDRELFNEAALTAQGVK